MTLLGMAYTQRMISSWLLRKYQLVIKKKIINYNGQKKDESFKKQIAKSMVQRVLRK